MKTRFAPSPTGYLHIGNVRTALFCDLLAKAKNGHFLLRIEDTDQSRSSTEFADHLQKDLHWLGLEWNEGPYYQSQRQAIYDDYYHRLEKISRAYLCFCTEQQLSIARKVQMASGQPPRYAGTCRHLTAEQIAQKIAQGLKSTWRFSVPEGEVIEFNDFVRGVQTFQSSEIGDFIIRRADGTAPFFFCNAIDDALMEVTHVLRGEDHLTNTPRQLLILKALNLATPTYGHLALIVGSDGSPLSKRHGSRNIQELRESGYIPQGIVNYLARLGHYYTSNDFMDLNQLAAAFSTESLGKAPAHFDAAQMLYWQKQAVANLSKDALWQWLGAEVQALVPAAQRDIFLKTIHSNVTFPANGLHWANVLFVDPVPYAPEALPILQQAGSAFFKTAIDLLPQHKTDFKALAHALQQATGLKGKSLYQPLRIALTGQLDGPEMVNIFELFGVDRIRTRLHHAEKIANK